MCPAHTSISININKIKYFNVLITFFSCKTMVEMQFLYAIMDAQRISLESKLGCWFIFWIAASIFSFLDN